jgi:S1-C subfamily serine protease
MQIQKDERSIGDLFSELAAETGTLVRPGLGINILSDQIAAQYKIDGVAVLGVAPGGAAEKAGIRGTQPTRGGWELGDVIVKLGNVDVHRSSDLFRAIDANKVGDEIDVTLQFQGQRRTVKVTLQPIQP